MKAKLKLQPLTSSSIELSQTHLSSIVLILVGVNLLLTLSIQQFTMYLLVRKCKIYESILFFFYDVTEMKSTTTRAALTYHHPAKEICHAILQETSITKWLWCDHIWHLCKLNDSFACIFGF